MKSPTQRKIAALKPLEKRYSVALGYGLSLKVQPSGAKSFVLRLCVSGRVTDILLGHFPEMSFGEAALQDDIGSTTGIISGAFVRGTRYQNTVNGLRGVPSYALKIKASSSNSTFGRNYSEVSVSAAYSLIIIKA